MNRRTFLASTAIIPSAFAEAAQAAQATKTAQPVTHVDTRATGTRLKSSVVKAKGLPAEGDSPGAKAMVNFNGPTRQLAAIATGAVTLEPGARPHPPHRHPEEELMIIAVGTGEIVVDGITTQVEPGDMMYAEANVLHGIVNTGKTQMIFYFTKIMPKHA